MTPTFLSPPEKPLKEFPLGSAWTAAATDGPGSARWTTFAVVGLNGKTGRVLALVLDTGYGASEGAAMPGETFTFMAKWPFCDRCERIG